MNFMRGLVDGMDFYRDERNREKAMRFLSEYYRTNASEELEETINVYSRVTPGLLLVTAKSSINSDSGVNSGVLQSHISPAPLCRIRPPNHRNERSGWGQPVRAMVRNQRCDRIGRPSRS